MNLAAILKEIQTHNDLNEVSYKIDELAKQSQTESLVILAKMIIENWDSFPESAWRYNSTIYRIINNLSDKQGEENLKALFEILQVPVFSKKITPQLSGIAARIIANQSVQSLHSALPDLNENLFEFAIIIVHGLVFHKLNLLDYPNFAAVFGKLKTSNHPLNILPLELLAQENELPIFLPFAKASQHPTAQPKAVEIPDIRFLAERLEEQELQNNNIAAAFENWENQSNGKIEARQFYSALPLKASSIMKTPLLLNIKLESLQETKPNDLLVSTVTPNHILNSLFSAACGGGAYSQGLGYAYGRLKSWQSVAGLMGLNELTDIPTAHEIMEQCTWLIFETKNSNWFYHVAWDVGIICLSADKKQLNILAATDTD